MAIPRPMPTLQTPWRKRLCRTVVTLPPQPPKPHPQGETAVAVAEGAVALLVASAELDSVAVGALRYPLVAAEAAMLVAVVAAVELDLDAGDGTAD